MDRSIGTLRDFLQKNKLKENTLLFYCGDNGTPTSAGHTGMTLREDKDKIYEGGIRVPGVIEWPAVLKKPAITSAISVTSDILPTLAEIAGQPLPDRPLDGTIWIPFFHNPEKTTKNKLFVSGNSNTKR